MQSNKYTNKYLAQRRWEKANPDKMKIIRKKCREKRKEKNAIYMREYAARNPEKIASLKKKWSDNNKEKTRSYGARYRKLYAEKIREREVKHRRDHKNDDSAIFYRYTYSARRRGLEFSLTKEQLVSFIDGKCHYCGIESNKEKRNGIDRKDNKSGYVHSNCVSSCWECNYLKRGKDYIQFTEHLLRIANYLCRTENGRG